MGKNDPLLINKTKSTPKKVDDNNTIDDLMKKSYTYPSQNDPDIQYKLYKKREYYFNKATENTSIKNLNYDILREKRSNVCARSFTLHEHQGLLSNLINPNTPYKGILVFHGLGSGKSCVGVAIAEQFKQMVQKYGTKIYILVPGPALKESWKHHLTYCTGSTYYNINIDEIPPQEKEKFKKQALAQALQYYKIMSYRSFHRKVLGEKIIEKKNITGSKTPTYRRTDEGEFDRDFAADRLFNLNNSIIIVDEAHNMTGNEQGKALKKIIESSINLRVVLMSATPMKNFGSDIVDLMNFLRPVDYQMERDKIFNSHKNHHMDFKKGGLEYLKNMIGGYVSYVRGSDPLVFAERIDHGTIPHGMNHTKMMRYVMLPFQKKVYETTITEYNSDSLDRKSEAVANCVFPGLSESKEIVGFHGKDGLANVRDQLKSMSELLNRKVGEKFFNGSTDVDFIRISDDGRSITGRIFKLPHLKNFSIKFYKALKKINQLVDGKKGPKTAFIYSNLVRVGINMFREVLLENGYLEFQEDKNNYHITSNTICYFCGKTFEQHKIDGNTRNHKFSPAVFISITGKSTEEKAESISEETNKILTKYFNNADNKDGKHIKFILGSKVINEGINMHNVSEVHILDVHFNLGRVDQVVGRAIRWCSHYHSTNENNVFPKVDVYKYVVSLAKDSKELSSEEELYRKAEIKYILIKKIERAMKERAIDCPLNIGGNIFPDELEKYKNCNKEGNEKCPEKCDYIDCFYKCDNVKLNHEYYDPNRMIYKLIDRNNLDYSTFTYNLALSEIDLSKKKIKEMYILQHYYTLEEIVEYVKNEYPEHKKDLFDEFFVFKALDSLVPITENDFNNFKDAVIDRNNSSGYLIHRNKYYIFQPFNQNEDIPMIYRVKDFKQATNEISLYNYLKNIDVQKYNGNIKKKSKKSFIEEGKNYNFDDTFDYYEERPEYEYVGIIDQETSKKKNKSTDEIKDIFKIREQLPKILDKKRGTGIPSLKGAVCNTAKSKEYLVEVSKKIGVNLDGNMTRTEICSTIKKEMLLREKYSTDIKKNKFTYVRIPSNHPLYPFPYNLEDRIKFITKKINNEIKHNINFKIEKIDKKSGPEKGYPSYKIIFEKDKKIQGIDDVLRENKAILENNQWIILVE
jgi:superfamily II DNA or RNA helicase